MHPSCNRKSGNGPPPTALLRRRAPDFYDFGLEPERLQPRHVEQEPRSIDVSPLQVPLPRRPNFYSPESLHDARNERRARSSARAACSDTFMHQLK